MDVHRWMVAAIFFLLPTMTMTMRSEKCENFEIKNSGKSKKGEKKKEISCVSM